MNKRNLLLAASLAFALTFLSGCAKILESIKPKPDTKPDTVISESPWRQLPGKATDISVSANGTVFITGTDTVSETGGYAISKLVGNSWIQLPGAAIRIAVDPADVPWVVNASNLLFSKPDTTSAYWKQLPGTGTDIGIGADGSVFITDTTVSSETGGFGIRKWNGRNWEQILGAAVRIAVDPSGNPWVVNKSGLIFKWVGNEAAWPWVQVTGSATDIGIGADGSIYITGSTLISETGGYGIFKWTGTGWEQLPGAAVNISVDPSGKPYFVNKSGAIFTSK